MVVDLVKRFSPTPLAANVPLNGVLVRVATNNSRVLDRLRAEAAGSGVNNRFAPTVDLRIVVEGETDAPGIESAQHSFTYDGLSFVRIANQSFFAADRQTRSGISFLARNLIEEDRLFAECVLPALVSILDEMKEQA